MAHRSPKEQEAHDKGVLATASELNKKGWDALQIIYKAMAKTNLQK